MNFLVGVKICPYSFVTASVINVKNTEVISSIYCASVKSITALVNRNESYISISSTLWPHLTETMARTRSLVSLLRRFFPFFQF